MVNVTNKFLLGYEVTLFGSKTESSLPKGQPTPFHLFSLLIYFDFSQTYTQNEKTLALNSRSFHWEQLHWINF